MHDHNTTMDMSSSSFHIDSMTVMWVLMGLMALHHFTMWREMKKMKKKEKCDCQ